MTKNKEERLREAIEIRKNLANHGLNTAIPGIEKLCSVLSEFVKTGESNTTTVRIPDYPNARIQLICSRKKKSGINILYD